LYWGRGRVLGNFFAAAAKNRYKERATACKNELAAATPLRLARASLFAVAPAGKHFEW